MNPQMMFQRLCALSGIVCPLLFFLGLLVAGFLPPMSPALSADQVAAFYQEHVTGIRVGAALIFLSSIFYILFTAVISGQMRRIPGIHATVLSAQLAAGSFAGLTFLVPAMLFSVTAFRPERLAESTLLLNDMSWILLVIAWAPFLPQYVAFAVGILSDASPNPLFPRWLAYTDIWVVILFVPAIMLPFFKTGLFAWNGLIVFWVPAVVFGVMFVVNTVCLWKALNSEERVIAVTPGLVVSDAVR